MIISGVDLLPCPRGHLAAQRTGEPGTLRCAACGSGFPEGTPVDVTLLCDGHPQPGQGQLPRYCSSVDQHLAWVRRVIRRASRFHDDDGAEAGAMSA